MRHKASKVPADYTHKIKTPTGKEIVAAFHPAGHIAGAWLPIDPAHTHGDGPTLSLVSTTYQGVAQDYVGYRDGHCSAERLAISVGSEGVTIQVVLPGVENEGSRVRILTLDQLDALILGSGLHHPE